MPFVEPVYIYYMGIVCGCLHYSSALLLKLIKNIADTLLGKSARYYP